MEDVWDGFLVMQKQVETGWKYLEAWGRSDNLYSARWKSERYRLEDVRVVVAELQLYFVVLMKS